MSGIAAIIDLEGGPVEPGLVERMTAAMAYRGPDGMCHWAKGSVALGHCMLRTTAESLEEAQPLANDDETVILVLDGYLTNWEGLRGELVARGVRLRNRSDAELVLRAYETWGEDCPSHIEGEYAFLVWDGRRYKAFCVRDHAGLRPLFYFRNRNVLVVASDIAAIAALPAIELTLNRGFMAEFMADDWVTRDETIWTGVMQLRPAHWLSLGKETVQYERYWSASSASAIRYKRDEEYFEHYRTMFAECVRRASRTHRPLAFEVSGGLDSSANFCMAHQLARQGRILAPQIKGYTFHVEAGSDADEIEFARAVGRHLGEEIREIPLFLPGIEWFEKQIRDDADIPPFPNAAMSNHLGGALVAEGCRVNINGMGGDQWLDGSAHYYFEQLTERDWSGLVRAFRTDLGALGARRTVNLLVRRGFFPFLPAPVRSLARTMRRFRLPGTATPYYWLSPELSGIMATRLKSGTIRDNGTRPAVDRGSKLDHPYWSLLFGLLSRQYAKLGYEPRSPMLSRAFIEFSAATPEHIRLRGGETKFIHRRALAGILPIEVEERRTKAEFSLAYEHHYKVFEDLCTGTVQGDLERFVDPAGLRRLHETRFDNDTCQPRGKPLSYHHVRELWTAWVCGATAQVRDR